VELVITGASDAGAESRRTLEGLTESGQTMQDTLRAFWSSPGYSHCCFTAHQELDAGIAQKITAAFISLHAIYRPAGQRGAGRRGLPGVCARHHDRLGSVRKRAPRAHPLTGDTPSCQAPTSLGGEPADADQH